MPLDQEKNQPCDFENDLDRLVGAMTFQEKAAMLAGRDAWHLHGVPRLGVASIRVADCGHGVTLVGDRAIQSTCFVTGVGMGATWNPDLIAEVGRAVGRECRAVGVSILLGPMLNLHRLPVGGRNFETFSEDPWLSARLGVAQVRGIQASGVGACIKSVVANNQQAFQMEASAQVDKRVLHELYLRTFELVVREAQPCGVMTSYNKINGEDAAANTWMIRDTIKKNWGHRGFVISDWGGVHDFSVMAAGLDLEMPGPARHMTAAAIGEALAKGGLTEEELDDRVRRILRGISTFGPTPQREEQAALNTPDHRRLARQVAAESITLLKNEDDLLPLNPAKLRRLAVIGPNAKVARLGGGGSASVSPVHAVSLLEGIEAHLGEAVDVVFAEGCGLSGDYAPMRGVLTHTNSQGQSEPGLAGAFFREAEVQGNPVHEFIAESVDFAWGWASPAPEVPRAEYGLALHGVITPEETGDYDLELMAQHGGVRLFLDGKLKAGDWRPDAQGNYEGRFVVQSHAWTQSFEAGKPVQVRLEYRKCGPNGGLRLAWRVPNRPSPMAHAVELARDADAVILCGGLSNTFEGGGHDREAFHLPGRQDELIERVLAANSRTVLVLQNATPVAMPWLDRLPALLEAWYPGQEGGHALADILFGRVNPSGRLPCTFPVCWEDVPAMAHYPGNSQTMDYGEGMGVGYRHTLSGGPAPLFPFGYGLSYTRFTCQNLRLSSRRVFAGDTLLVEVDVTNTGDRPGLETVQLYLGLPHTFGKRPDYELRLFEKVHLEVSQTKTLRFEVGQREMESFSPQSQSWVVVSGRYRIRVGPHCLKGLEGSFRVAETGGDSGRASAVAGVVFEA